MPVVPALLSGAGPHLVEAARAVDRPVVPRQERDERLATAFGADRGMHLALAAIPAADAEGSVLLGDRPTALAALGLVDETLLRIELLLTGAEDEVHPAVSAADGLVGVHPLPCLLCLRLRPGLDDCRLLEPDLIACRRLRGSVEDVRFERGPDVQPPTIHAGSTPGKRRARPVECRPGA